MTVLVQQAEIYAPSRTRFNELQHRELFDVRCENDQITEISSDLEPLPGETVIDARGGLLLPGLHDHHFHLFSYASSLQSVNCGPPEVQDTHDLVDVLSRRTGDGWIRGFGYHESVAGLLDRHQIDEWVKEKPVRIQHRSGKMWFLNSRAIEHLELEEDHLLEGIECDNQGSPTGRFFRLDRWLGMRLQNSELPDIKTASEHLAAFGVTGITDTTPGNSVSTANLFDQLVWRDDILQKVHLMGDDSLSSCQHSFEGALGIGPRKILLDDYALPTFDELKATIANSHQCDRAVAIHCVTSVELIFAMSALREVGVVPGDRIEHASVVTRDVLPLLSESGVTVVTQPNFIYERGDQYLLDVPGSEHDCLYRTRSLIEAAIPVGGSTDAPFGVPDPWKSMDAAMNRRTRGGQILGENERLTPGQALKLFLTSAKDPGGPARVIEVGSSADLCLLDSPWHEICENFQHQHVRATISSGRLIFQRE